MCGDSLSTRQLKFDKIEIDIGGVLGLHPADEVEVQKRVECDGFMIAIK